jgi:hypothetical protein
MIEFVNLTMGSRKIYNQIALRNYGMTITSELKCVES